MNAYGTMTIGTAFEMAEKYSLAALSLVKQKDRVGMRYASPSEIFTCLLREQMENYFNSAGEIDYDEDLRRFVAGTSESMLQMATLGLNVQIHGLRERIAADCPDCEDGPENRELYEELSEEMNELIAAVATLFDGR
jgi:hypothetical protein